MQLKALLCRHRLHSFDAQLSDQQRRRVDALNWHPSHAAHLAFQAQAKVLFATYGGLIYADAQAAVPCREGRRHNLLDPDHVAEQPKVVHPPCELAAAQGVVCSGLQQTCQQQQQPPHVLNEMSTAVARQVGQRCECGQSRSFCRHLGIDVVKEILSQLQCHQADNGRAVGLMSYMKVSASRQLWWQASPERLLASCSAAVCVSCELHRLLKHQHCG